MSNSRLGKDFYDLPTTQLAQELLGKVLVRRLSDGKQLRGIVVEVEAYLAGDDPASHSYRGPGRKNASMFLQPGRLYVYPIHSRHCLNIVTEPHGQGAAVLIRAVEPVTGIEAMRVARNIGDKLSSPTELARLTKGPGRLCEAFEVDRTLDGIDLCSDGRIWLEEDSSYQDVAWNSRQSCRIGISQATTLQLRWFLDGNYFVSGCARDHSAGRHWSFTNW